MGFLSSSWCLFCALEDNDKVTVAMIADDGRSHGDRVQKVAASTMLCVDFVREIGFPLSSMYCPSHAMEDGVTAKVVATMG